MKLNPNYFDVIVKFTFITLLFFISIEVQAKSYKVERVVIEARIQPDGSVFYKEIRTYNFDGSYSKANYELSKRGFDSIRDVTISENGIPFILSDSDYPGTYSIRERNRTIDITWNYDAEDESKSFEISYLIEGGLVVGPYDTEFFWTYLSDRWETGTESLEVRVYLPDSLDPQRQFTWVRGSDAKVVLQKLQDGFQVQSIERFTKHNEIAVRLIFPSSLIDSPVTDADFSLEDVLADEAALEQRAIEAQERREVLLPFGRAAGVLIILLSIFFWIVRYRKYGVKHQSGKKAPDVIFKAPVPLKPALASWLIYSRNVVAYALAATLFDLARKGFYVLEEDQIETKFLKKEKTIVYLKKPETIPSTEGLYKFELMLMEFLDEKIAENPRLDKIFKSTDSKLTKWYSKWSKSLGDEGKAMNLIEPESKSQMKKMMLLQAFFMVVSGALAILVLTPELIVALAISFTMFIASFAIMRYTPQGQLLFDNFKAYYNGLKMAAKRASDGFPSYTKENLDMHMIYAIGFGITGKKLESLLSSMNFQQDDVSWMYFSTNSQFGMSSVIHSISSVTNSVVTTTTSFSGAGASAGSAGGGAGGGAS
ncbi:MAG TPA: hypothetical protein DCE78_09600 [Bacteroidetes bacterium]|nr:hypothetical protein [Bacteroidota bacterium]